MKRDRIKYLCLINYLAERVGYRCELCGRPPDFRGLQGAHIIRRSKGIISAPDRAWNVLIACGVCHDHIRFPQRGYEITEEEALAIARVRNERLGIDPDFEG